MILASENLCSQNIKKLNPHVKHGAMYGEDAHRIQENGFLVCNVSEFIFIDFSGKSIQKYPLTLGQNGNS